MRRSMTTTTAACAVSTDVRRQRERDTAPIFAVVDHARAEELYVRGHFHRA